MQKWHGTRYSGGFCISTYIFELIINIINY